MKINIISIGHKPPTWAEEGCKEYLKRFQRDLSIVLTELKPAFRVSDTDKNHLARAKEKGRILTKLNKNARLIALDEAGTQTTTNELARLLTNWMAEGRDLDFVIGGADGLDPEIKNQADKMLSLSLMTYPHALARLILIEQLYRAQCIIKKHPYHRD
ncbi:MAG: 23S rRNA (pseudouridine(1915)-N(3))-methyltransferase RlmH [Burkholderiales bacterium]|jgi:23S rRNA (pseudouridine1915-N3)-methyltransferase|nr:23S rRNA (pseudouridine(1915)-N(3))-methyltransferase RlmH [Burkholderiales bacterium]HAT51853.1 23S rRNA (pseudouridine(1915)-N(3))-methyltransferase RlmH [Betaproteobacteria bacterium]